MLSRVVGPGVLPPCEVAARLREGDRPQLRWRCAAGRGIAPATPRRRPLHRWRDRVDRVRSTRADRGRQRLRVLQRLDAMPGGASEKEVMAWAWERAAALVNHSSVSSSSVPSDSQGGFKTPREGQRRRDSRRVQRRPDGTRPHPGARPRRPSALSVRCVTCVSHASKAASRKSRPPRRGQAQPRVSRHRGGCSRETARGVEVLLEQRPATGLWAGLWQPPTVESATRKLRTLKSLLAELGLPASASRTKPREWVFQTTHREVCFRIWVCPATGDDSHCRTWIAFSSIHEAALSNAHRDVLQAAAAAMPPSDRHQRSPRLASS